MSEGGELVHFHDWRAARDRKAVTRTRPTKASGSYLGCLTSKRSSGQG